MHLADAKACIIFHVCATTATLKQPTLLIKLNLFKIMFSAIPLMLPFDTFTYHSIS